MEVGGVLVFRRVEENFNEFICGGGLECLVNGFVLR